MQSSYFGLIEFNLQAHQSFLEPQSSPSISSFIRVLFRRSHQQGGHVRFIFQFHAESLRQLRKSSRFIQIRICTCHGCESVLVPSDIPLTAAF
jgi:hypothetical protein